MKTSSITVKVKPVIEFDASFLEELAKQLAPYIQRELRRQAKRNGSAV